MDLLDALREHGRDAVSFQAVEPGIETWADPHEEGIVAYCNIGSALDCRQIAARRRLASRGRRGRCSCAQRAIARKRAVFFGCDEAFSTNAIVVGEQPWWRVRDLLSVPKENRRLREQLRRARAKSVRVRKVDASELNLGSNLRREIRSRSPHLGSTTCPMQPMKFVVTLAMFEHAHLHRYYEARRDGELIAFSFDHSDFRTLFFFLEDLVRDSKSTNGTTELLFDCAMRDLPDDAEITWGLAPLTEAAPRAMRWLGAVARRSLRFSRSPRVQVSSSSAQMATGVDDCAESKRIRRDGRRAPCVRGRITRSIRRGHARAPSVRAHVGPHASSSFHGRRCSSSCSPFTARGLAPWISALGSDRMGHVRCALRHGARARFLETTFRRLRFARVRGGRRHIRVDDAPHARGPRRVRAQRARTHGKRRRTRACCARACKVRHGYVRFKVRKTHIRVDCKAFRDSRSALRSSGARPSADARGRAWPRAGRVSSRFTVANREERASTSTRASWRLQRPSLLWVFRCLRRGRNARNWLFLRLRRVSSRALREAFRLCFPASSRSLARGASLR